MPRRFFRKFALKRDYFHDRWFLAPFAHLFHDQRLWGVRRRTIVPAFALGTFIAFAPIPGHVLIAAFMALLLRINIPVAALTTFISNPLTIGPMYYFAYRLGMFLLGSEPQPFNFELSVSWMFNSFVTMWQPLVLGCVLLGAVASLAGYIGLDLLWRASIADYLEARRRRRASNSDEHR